MQASTTVGVEESKFKKSIIESKKEEKTLFSMLEKKIAKVVKIVDQ